MKTPEWDVKITKDNGDFSLEMYGRYPSMTFYLSREQLVILKERIEKALNDNSELRSGDCGR